MARLIYAALMIGIVSAVPAPGPPKSTLDFVILHNNDMHSRFEQTGKYSNICRPEEVVGGKCYGGFARVATYVKKFRNDAINGGPPVLYLNAGDTYTGTPWFTLYRDRIVADFMNMLKPDAIVSGMVKWSGRPMRLRISFQQFSLI